MPYVFHSLGVQLGVLKSRFLLDPLCFLLLLSHQLLCPLNLYLPVVCRNSRGNLRLWNVQIPNCYSVLGKASYAAVQIHLNRLSQVDELGVEDLVDGMVCAKSLNP